MLKRKKKEKEADLTLPILWDTRAGRKGGRFLETRPTGWPHGCWRFKFTLCPPFWRLRHLRLLGLVKLRPQTGGLKQQTVICLSSRDWKSKIRVPMHSFQGEALPLAGRWLPPPWYPHDLSLCVQGERGEPWSLFLFLQGH